MNKLLNLLLHSKAFGTVKGNFIGKIKSFPLRRIFPTSGSLETIRFKELSMKSVFLFLSFTISVFTFAQSPSFEWQKCLGGSLEDYAHSVQQTTDGGYIVAANAYSNNGNVSGNHGSVDIWVVKLNPSGLIEWQKCFGGSSSEYVYSIQQTNDDGYVLVGNTNSLNGDVSVNNGSTDVWVLKINSTGIIEWQKSFGGSLQESAYCVQETVNGDYIIAGSTASNDGDVIGHNGISPGGSQFSDFWVIKLNANGDLLWQNCLGGIEPDVAFSVQQTIDGGYVVAGRTWSNDGDVSGNHGFMTSDIWIVKLDSSGNLLWQRCLGGSMEELANSIKETSDGGFIVVGQTSSNDGDVIGNNGFFDSWVVKLNSIGQIQWQKCLGGTTYDYYDNAHDVNQTQDGGFILAGYTESNDGDVTGNHGGGDAWVLKLNATGDLIWQKCFGGSYFDYTRSIQQTTDGGFILAGYTESNDGDVTGNHGEGDSWVLKLSGELNIVDLDQFSKNKKMIKILDITGRDVSPLPNQLFIYQYDDGSTEMKVVMDY